MTTETTAPTATEALNTAAEAVDPAQQAAQSTDDDGQEPESTESKPEKTEAEKELERLQRELTNEKRRLVKRDRVQGKMHAELQTLRQQIAQLSPQQQQEQGLTPERLQAYIEQQAEALAEQKVQGKTLNEGTNKTIQSGHKEYGQSAFDLATEKFVEEIGGTHDERGQLNPVVKAVLKLPDAHKVVKYLGDNPEIAAELADLEPFELGMKLAEVKAAVSTKPAAKPVSKAPEPVRPIGATRSQGGLESMSQAEYEATRKAQGAYWSR